MFRILSRLISLIIVVSFAATLRSDENKSESVQTPKPLVSKALKDAQDHVSVFHFHQSQKDGPVAVEMVAHPLLTFGDATRGNEAGTLWAWGTTGRPLAMMEQFRPVENQTTWIHAWTLTSPSLLTFDEVAGQQWKTTSSHFELKDVPDAPKVSLQPTMRLRQMKEISRRFDAHEFWDPDNSRFELRLLIQPVHRYADGSQSVIDGAVFVLAHDTNPEILVQLEAHGDSNDARWKVSFSRLGSAELHVLLDGKEFWTVPRTPNVVGQPSDPYWLMLQDAG
jgi:hypothetical protein